MNSYICYYKGLQFQVYANNRAEAYSKALDYFKPPRKKRHLITVSLDVLAEKNGMHPS